MAYKYLYLYLCGLRGFGYKYLYLYFGCFGGAEDFGGEQEKPQKVWEGHQGAEDIGKRPDRPHRQKSAQHQHRKKEKAKEFKGRLLGKKIEKALASVKAPAKDRGQAEKEKAKKIKKGDKAFGKGQGLKGGEGDLGAGKGGIGPNACEHQRKAGKGAEQNGIDKGAQHGDEPLGMGRAAFCAGGGDGVAAHSRFIGKDPSPKAKANGFLKGKAADAAQGGLWAKG